MDGQTYCFNENISFSLGWASWDFIDSF